MLASPNRFIIVDTNCFLRLYHSPILPLMGQDIAGYRLLTLKNLVDEFQNNCELIQSYPSVATGDRYNDLISATLKLSGVNKKKVSSTCRELAQYANNFLELYCKKQKISRRKLSSPDIELLATTIVLKGVMATDEWPLRLVAKDLMEDQDEYKIELFNSLELLHLMECNGKISPNDRRKTIRSWVLYREKLLNGWKNDYYRLFGESANLLEGV